MLKRTVVALVALPLFFLAVYFTPEWVLPAALGLLAGLAAHEMLHNTGLVTSRILLTAAILLSIISIPLTFYFDLPLVALVVPSAVIIFVIAIASKGKISNSEVFGTFFTVIFMPMALGSIVRIRAMEGGITLVILPFIAAWITDTCAYFTGRALGRHKLAPEISPKKTVEGSIGGILGCIAVMLAYNYVAGAIWGVSYSLPLLAVIAASGSIISQAGDLAMSYIKRGFGIKDYGTIMPGHGGILDRFDSVLFTAPFIELLLSYITVIL